MAGTSSAVRNTLLNEAKLSTLFGNVIMALMQLGVLGDVAQSRGQPKKRFTDRGSSPIPSRGKRQRVSKSWSSSPVDSGRSDERHPMALCWRLPTDDDHACTENDFRERVPVDGGIHRTDRHGKGHSNGVTVLDRDRHILDASASASGASDHSPILFPITWDPAAISQSCPPISTSGGADDPFVHPSTSTVGAVVSDNPSSSQSGRRQEPSVHVCTFSAAAVNDGNTPGNFARGDETAPGEEGDGNDGNNDGVGMEPEADAGVDGYGREIMLGARFRWLGGASHRPPCPAQLGVPIIVYHDLETTLLQDKAPTSGN